MQSEHHLARMDTRDASAPTSSAVVQSATHPSVTSAPPGPVTAAAPLIIDVVGTPAPQGSKRAFVVNGHAVLTESSKKVKPWRQDVAAAVQAVLSIEDWWAIPAGPVRVDITYYLPRPRYHYRTGKRANELRPSAPSYCDKKPDKDKLDRATCDALTSSGVIRDDAQIAAGYTVKRYANGATGARITIRPLSDSVSASASLPGVGADTDNQHPHAAALSLPRDGAAPAPHPDAPHAVAGCGAGPSAPQTPGVRMEGEATGRRDTTTPRTGVPW